MKPYSRLGRCPFKNPDFSARQDYGVGKTKQTCRIRKALKASLRRQNKVVPF